jgi:hypothetical protein
LLTRFSCVIASTPAPVTLLAERIAAAVAQTALPKRS